MKLKQSKPSQTFNTLNKLWWLEIHAYKKKSLLAAPIFVPVQKLSNQEAILKHGLLKLKYNESSTDFEYFK